jgi:hypothetical protein
MAATMCEIPATLDLDPARMAVPPLDGLDLPRLRAAMWGLDAELTAGGAGFSDQSRFSQHF